MGSPSSSYPCKVEFVTLTFRRSISLPCMIGTTEIVIPTRLKSVEFVSVLPPELSTTALLEEVYGTSTTLSNVTERLLVVSTLGCE